MTAALLLALAFFQQDPSAQTPTTGPVMHPVWTRKFTVEEYLRAFPPQALKTGLHGFATIHCKVDAHGQLEACQTMPPTDEVFGPAAIELAKSFAMQSLDSDGAPVAGRDIYIPIRFTPPPR